MANGSDTIKKSYFGLGLLTLVGLIFLPLFVYYIWIGINFHDGQFYVPGESDLALIPAPTWEAATIFSGWLLLQWLLQMFAPGPMRPGTVLESGQRLDYKMNGWFSFCVTVLLVAVGLGFNLISPRFIVAQFGPLLTTVNIFAFGLSFLLLFSSDNGGMKRFVTGNPFFDFFMGVTLNPRWLGVDLKFFFESRPGLIGWAMLNVIFAAYQYELHGEVTIPMMLVTAFHFFYVADYFWHEEAILTTWDIKEERFGWMLVWGDNVWVPFTYTLQAQYLLTHTHSLPVWGTAGIVLLNVAGYVIFRGTNLQKHKFRKDPERPVWGRKAEFIETQRGSRLLTSGWWGLARHINYLGDLMMALAWCLPCLFAAPLPYFYFIYFTILLVHRERRDHHRCLEKYGSDWQLYCEKVPWRIVPGVY